jgi:hypothetical protein
MMMSRCLAVAGVIILTAIGTAQSKTCGAGFTEIGNHGAFYNETNAGKLAYAPYATSSEKAKTTQIFCLFNEVGPYEIESRPRKIVFVLNNMRGAEDPDAIVFLGVRFVRVGSGSSAVAIETWKKPSELWKQSRNGKNPFNDIHPAARDKFQAAIQQLGSEDKFVDETGIDLFGTTAPGPNGHSYSTWERRDQLPPLDVSNENGLKYTMIPFSNRDTPPKRNDPLDRKHRVVFEISPAKSSALILSVYAPPEIASLPTRSYRIEFGDNR